MGALNSIRMSRLRIASNACFRAWVMLVLGLASAMALGAEAITPGAGVTPAWAYPVNPLDLKPSMPVPEDFDQFWAAQKAALANAAINSTLTPAKAPEKGMESLIGELKTQLKDSSLQTGRAGLSLQQNDREWRICFAETGSLLSHGSISDCCLIHPDYFTSLCSPP